MMKAKNFQEQLVYGTIDSIFKEKKDMVENELIRSDVAALVLNQLKPRYITSDRGYSRAVGSMLYEPQQNEIIKIITLINNAIEIVLKRRKDASAHSQEKQKSVIDGNSLVCIKFPVIVGNVRDANTNHAIEDVEVSLYNSDNTKTVMGSTKWENPTLTKEGNLACFSFWIQPIKNAHNTPESNNVEFSFNIRTKHASYQPKDTLVTLVAEYCRYSHVEFDFNDFHNVGEILLTPRGK